MITEEELDTLDTFGRENDGCYSDRWEFAILPSNRLSRKERKLPTTKWMLCFESEVDGALCLIKYLKDFDDLKNVYHAITDNKLT